MPLNAAVAVRRVEVEENMSAMALGAIKHEHNQSFTAI